MQVSLFGMLEQRCETLRLATCLHESPECGMIEIGRWLRWVDGFEWQIALGYRIASNGIRLLAENEEIATSGRHWRLEDSAKTFVS